MGWHSPPRRAKTQAAYCSTVTTTNLRGLIFINLLANQTGAALLSVRLGHYENVQNQQIQGGRAYGFNYPFEMPLRVETQRKPPKHSNTWSPPTSQT